MSHEDSDVEVGLIARGAAWLIGGTVLVAVAVWLLFGWFQSSADTVVPDHPLAVGQAPRIPPGPRLQVQPRLDYARQFRTERALLTGYHWIDKDAGVVRIPIEEAMRRVVDRGLPARAVQPPQAQAAPEGDRR